MYNLTKFRYLNIVLYRVLIIYKLADMGLYPDLKLVFSFFYKGIYG